MSFASDVKKQKILTICNVRIVFRVSGRDLYIHSRTAEPNMIVFAIAKEGRPKELKAIEELAHAPIEQQAQITTSFSSKVQR